MKKEEIINCLDMLKDSIKNRTSNIEVDAELVLDCLIETIENLKFIVERIEKNEK